MKQFGLIGSGIQDSGSPALFKAAFGGKYPYELLDGKEFDPLFERFDKSYHAVNVTSPFKELALKAADEASDAAQLCGAANMLIHQPSGKILADNSDFEGVTLSIISAYAMNDEDVDVEDEDALAEFLLDKTALVVGCGGAGKAAAAAVVTMGFGKTLLINRTKAKADALKKHIVGFYEDLEDDEIEVLPAEKFPEAFAKADFIVYTVPEAIDGIEKIDAGCLTKGKYILEANYKTPVFEKFKDRCTYISGFNWLLNQAIISYEEFTGCEPDEEAMRRVNL